MVLPSRVRPHVPAVVRKAHDVIPLGLLGRARDQLLQLRITAHDAIQGDELCRLDLRSQVHKIAVAKLHPASVATALRFLFGRGNIGSGRFEMDGPPDAPFEQLMVEDADASSDCARAAVKWLSVATQWQLGMAHTRIRRGP